MQKVVHVRKIMSGNFEKKGSLLVTIELEKVSQPRPTKIYDRSLFEFGTLMVAQVNVVLFIFNGLLQLHLHWVVLPLGYQIQKKTPIKDGEYNFLHGYYRAQCW